MRDEEILNKLLKIKRYERPTDDYFERLADEVQKRLAVISPRLTLGDRIDALVDSLLPKNNVWPALAGGALATVVFALLVWNNQTADPNAGPSLVSNSDSGQKVALQDSATTNEVELAETHPIDPVKAVVESSRLGFQLPAVYHDLITPVSHQEVYSMGHADDIFSPELLAVDPRFATGEAEITEMLPAISSGAEEVEMMLRREGQAVIEYDSSGQGWLTLRFNVPRDLDAPSR